MPVNKLETESKKEIAKQISKNAIQLLSLNEELLNSKLQSKKEQIQGRLEYLSSKINELVYELYDLTKEEIELVESN